MLTGLTTGGRSNLHSALARILILGFQAPDVSLQHRAVWLVVASKRTG